MFWNFINGKKCTDELVPCINWRTHFVAASLWSVSRTHSSTRDESILCQDLCSLSSSFCNKDEPHYIQQRIWDIRGCFKLGRFSSEQELKGRPLCPVRLSWPLPRKPSGAFRTLPPPEKYCVYYTSFWHFI